MSTNASTGDLKIAIESQHGGIAEYLQSVPVDERYDAKIVWQGVVHVFEMKQHPKANRAYAWSSPIEGSDKRRFFAVLGIPPINTPVDAVRAAIVAEQRVAEARN